MADSNRTEKATPKKRRDARKKGNVFQSRELVAAASLIIIVLALKILAKYLFALLQTVMRKFIGVYATADKLTLADLRKLTLEVILYVAVMTVPFLLLFALVSFLASGAQTRFIFKIKLKFEFNRINPLKGFQRMFSLKSAVELLKSILKLTAIGFMVYKGVLGVIKSLPDLMDMGILGSVVYIAGSLYDILIGICLLILVIGVMDFMYQWWEYERNLRMTKQEVIDEYKQTEGDPQIKGAIKSRQRAMAMSRMMRALPEADVVITNPTHFAVALKYDSQKNNAPVVIAKGQDLIALRIKEKAKELGLEITENPPLARALYKAVDIGDEIPPQFYQAVGEILAYIYRKRHKQLN